MWTEFEELTRTGLADNVRTAAAHEQRWLYEAASTGAKARVAPPQINRRRDELWIPMPAVAAIVAEPYVLRKAVKTARSRL